MKSRIIYKLQHIITPVVTGIVITTIGLSLIKVGMTDIAGGFGNPDIGDAKYLIVGSVTLATIILINRSSNQVLRLSGMLVGYITAYYMDMVSFEIADVALISIPVPFKYGFYFDLAAFIPVAIISIVTAIETTGDLTAKSMVSRQPTQGQIYISRIRGGVRGDVWYGRLCRYPYSSFCRFRSS